MKEAAHEAMLRRAVHHLASVCGHSPTPVIAARRRDEAENFLVELVEYLGPDEEEE